MTGTWLGQWLPASVMTGINGCSAVFQRRVAKDRKGSNVDAGRSFTKVPHSGRMQLNGYSSLCMFSPVGEAALGLWKNPLPSLDPWPRARNRPCNSAAAENSPIPNFRPVEGRPQVIAVDFEAHIRPGTFEHGVSLLVDQELDLSPFIETDRNDDAGALIPAQDPLQGHPVRRQPWADQLSRHLGGLPPAHAVHRAARAAATRLLHHRRLREPLRPGDPVALPPGAGQLEPRGRRVSAIAGGAIARPQPAMSGICHAVLRLGCPRCVPLPDPFRASGYRFRQT